MENLVVADLLLFTEGTKQDRTRFIETLGQAFYEIGFIIIQNHFMPPDLQAALHEKAEAFFRLPDGVKERYIAPDTAGQRGYTPKNMEHAKGRTVPDLKEFFHVGPEISDPNDPLYHHLPKNIWPAEIPQFKEVVLEAYQKFLQTGQVLLRAIALYLDLEEDYFDSRIQNGPSLLRILHYYALNPDISIPDGAVRAAEHEDIDFITLLTGASSEGLEVLTRQGTWLAPKVAPNEMVVNVGDMLQRLTNNYLRSTTHRVVLPPPDKRHLPRFSMPFFVHPRPEVSLACLPSCVTPSRPKAYPDITANAFLEERLREIGLKG